MTKEQVYRCADTILARGEQPTVELVNQDSDISGEEVARYLDEWRKELPERLHFAPGIGIFPEMPQNLSAQFGRIWQYAVEEAGNRLADQYKASGESMEEARKVSDDALHEMQRRKQELENRIRIQQDRIEAQGSSLKSLEAEIAILKSSLGSEADQRKKSEQACSNLEHELAHLKKTHEDAKRTFDQRIKEEQRHTLETASKAEADSRYYKNALDKLRDETGKKEALLSKEIHDLKAELAKREVRIDTQTKQARSQEEELKSVKQETGQQSRELARSNSALLAEANKVKRLEDKNRELELEIKRLNQKQLHNTTEWSRRESHLRIDLKEREDELSKAMARLVNLEKRIIGQDEEIRRLNARL